MATGSTPPVAANIARFYPLGGLYLARAQLRWLRVVHKALLTDPGAPQILAPGELPPDTTP